MVKETKLYKWCLEQARLYKEGKLEKWKIDNLRKIGFPFKYYIGRLNGK